MVLDPFTAIGLAGNIVQFVDFALKLVSDAREIRSSAKGLTSRHDFLEYHSQHLIQITVLISEASAGGAAAVGADLIDLCNQCNEITDAIQQALGDLKAKEDQAAWKSFVQAMRECGRQGQLLDWSKKLNKLQSLLTLRLMVLLTKRQSYISHQLEGLIVENRRLNMDRTQGIERLKTEVIDALNVMAKTAPLANNSLEKHMSKILWQKPVSGADIDALSNKMTTLSRKLSSLTREGKTVASEQMLLRSLWFPAMREREENVAKANDNTLHWIFEGMPPDSFEGTHPRLKQWLEQENGIYWIRGKPGSGKSTLMKYLCNHKTTGRVLGTWASPKPPFKASYFFWCAGSKLQRSMKGLLQSLLYDVLRQCPELICHVYPDLEGMHYQSDYEPWSFAELQEAVELLREQNNVSARFCFFIDGLDEYDAETVEGTHAQLIHSLKVLAQSPDIKLCVSSRPWSIFMDAFGGTPERMLALEDLNRDNIHSYVSNTFAENQRFVELKSQDNRYQELIAEIVEKAQGVFLWVFLVVRSLEKGLESSDRIIDLQRRLRLLPQDLKEFFRQILGSVDEVYQKQTAELFKMMLDTPLPISLMTLSVADEEDIDFSLKTRTPLNIHEIRERQGIMRRRIDARCKGLVEVAKLPTRYSSDGSHYFVSTKVEFLHRTVRDFLKNKEMEDFFECFTQDFDPHLVLLRSFLGQLKLLPVSNEASGPKDTLLEQLGYCARRLEEEVGSCPPDLLNEAERASNMGTQAYLGFLAQRGVAKYLARRVESNPALLRNRRPLLDYALDPPVEEFSDRRVIRANVVQILLKLGANPNQSYEGSTVWGRFAQKLSAKQSVFKPDSLFQSTKLLLQHNADTAKSIQVGWQTRQGGGRTGRASDMYGGTKLPLYLKAIDVVDQCESFTSEQRRELLQTSKQQKIGAKNWPKLLLNRAFWIGAGRISR